jgi:hypothetical protein
MKKYAGLWIDHRPAVIVRLLDEGEETRRIESNIEKCIHYSGASHARSPTGHDDAAEGTRDRRYTDHLNNYHDEGISFLRDGESILVLGPGEAKGELQKRLEGQKISRRSLFLKQVTR